MSIAASIKLIAKTASRAMPNPTTSFQPGDFDREDFNLARYLLAENVRRWPAKAALTMTDGAGNNECWCFGDIERAVRRLTAGLLAMDLAPGARVMIRMSNRVEFALVFFAATAAGLVAVPTSAQLTAAEAGFIARDSGAAVVVLGDGLDVERPLPGGARILDLDAVREMMAADDEAEPVHLSADAPAFMIYTSGTTGAPKGVLHAHRTVWGRRPMGPGWHGMGPDDRVLHAGQLNWTYTLGVGLMDPWAHGAGTLIYNGPRDPAVWPRLINAHDVTIFAAVPTVYRQILKYADIHGGADAPPMPSLRHGLTAGEALAAELGNEWFERTGTRLYEALGMSEISTFISSGPVTPIRPGSPGRPQPGRRIAVFSPEGDGPYPLPAGETGLLAIHRDDPGLMLGYWRRPDEDKSCFRGEWFVTADLVSIDGDGYVWHLGRADDVMNAFGYRVSPVEVENALADCPGIAEVAVTEAPVRDGITAITAFVVTKPGATIDEESVIAWAHERLAHYKCPRAVRVVDRLPRTNNGKVMRRALATMATAM